jgi:hypothetical protein
MFGRDGSHCFIEEEEEGRTGNKSIEGRDARDSSPEDERS